MMRKIVNGRPVFHIYTGSPERMGQEMTANELRAFAVEALADEYRQTGAYCTIREKRAKNEADLGFLSMGTTQINILVVYREDRSISLDGIDTTWLVDEYHRKGIIPRVTFAFLDTPDGRAINGNKYSFTFHSISVMPGEYNDFMLEELSPIELAEKYAETWRNLDASIVEPYLDKDFHYKSDWVFDEMPCRYEYLNYFRPKLQTIRKAGADINVKVGVNKANGKVGIIMQQENNNCILLLTTANGRITSAHMAEYIPDYVPADGTLMYRQPDAEGWTEAYEEKLATGLKAAGWFIQECFNKQNIEFPEFRWIQTELCYPAFHHLAFAYKGNIYSVLFEFVNSDGNHVFPRDIKNQLRECAKYDLIACTIPMDYDTYEPLVQGNHLILTETRKPVVFSEQQQEVLMSEWEIHNFGVSFVRDTLRKEGKRIMSFCDLPSVEPKIWFEDVDGRKCYVIVNTITGNNPEAVNYKLNQQLLLKFLDYEGYYTEVGVFPSDPIVYDTDGNLIPLSKRNSLTNPCELLYRDKTFHIYYSGLKYIELKAAENGVNDTEIFVIRDDMN